LNQSIKPMVGGRQLKSVLSLSKDVRLQKRQLNRKVRFGQVVIRTFKQYISSGNSGTATPTTEEEDQPTVPFVLNPAKLKADGRIIKSSKATTPANNKPQIIRKLTKSDKKSPLATLAGGYTSVNFDSNFIQQSALSFEKPTANTKTSISSNAAINSSDNGWDAVDSPDIKAAWILRFRRIEGLLESDDALQVSRECGNETCGISCGEHC